MIFTPSEYYLLSELVFQDWYPGYRKNVVESPNGDENWDTEKRYAHVAHKYLKKNWWNSYSASEELMLEYFNIGMTNALRVAVELGVPKAFWPDGRYSALRILEYPPGSVSHKHTDFDLFTLMCYRNIPELFKYAESPDNHLMKANELNEQIHFGEMLELINPNYKATPHRVDADKCRAQYSIIFFAIPDHEAVFPSGVTVGEWLDERMSRSRSEAA